MSRIVQTQLLQVESFPDQKDWIAQLLTHINDVNAQTISIVNKGLVFSDNILGIDHTFDFEYTSDAVSFPRKVLWSFGLSPQALQIVSATEDSAPIIALASWDFDGTHVRLKSAIKATGSGVSGLTAGKQYKLRCRITP